MLKKIFLLLLILANLQIFGGYHSGKATTISETASSKSLADLKKQLDNQNYAIERLESKFEKLKSEVEALKPKDKTKQTK